MHLKDLLLIRDVLSEVKLASYVLFVSIHDVLNRMGSKLQSLVRSSIMASSAYADNLIKVRFSTVGGESGSADTARDPRGFAVK